MTALTSQLASILTLAQNDAGGAGAAVGGLAFLCCFAVVGIALFGFWLWMLIDCCQRTFPGDNDKVIWVIVIVLLGALGALIYYFIGRPKGTKA